MRPSRFLCYTLLLARSREVAWRPRLPSTCVGIIEGGTTPSPPPWLETKDRPSKGGRFRCRIRPAGTCDLAPRRLGKAGSGGPLTPPPLRAAAGTPARPPTAPRRGSQRPRAHAPPAAGAAAAGGAP